mmetsp:Transcript_118411/g.209303  ORF Transcript_118411/g.209303 Transcript_118411/m.209303 type:complete len:160 (-) Transcript_118411:1380-1859(-)
MAENCPKGLTSTDKHQLQLRMISWIGTASQRSRFWTASAISSLSFSIWFSIDLYTAVFISSTKLFGVEVGLVPVAAVVVASSSVVVARLTLVVGAAVTTSVAVALVVVLVVVGAAVTTSVAVVLVVVAGGPIVVVPARRMSSQQTTPARIQGVVAPAQV